MQRRARVLVCVLSIAGLSGAPAAAQTGVTLLAHALVYGDNTEFRNPFREGETLFGAALRLAAAADLDGRATLTVGVFVNQRFGSEDAIEQVRPIITLTVRGARSSFVLGALPPSPHATATGPDLNGPHGLLPVLQRESLAFERPYEAGLQWLFTGSRLRHDVWLNWQRLNTADHRERFDAGVNGELDLGGRAALPFQAHIVHEGGQQFAVGPVADSLAGALGLVIRGRAGAFERVAAELHAVASRFVPDRGAPLRSRNGAGFVARASGELEGWRGHVLFWRGDDVVTDEGDPNYLSIRRDGSRYRGVRDYAELGVARLFRPVAGVTVQASVRVHRTERHYEYSYRILGATALHWKVR